MSEFPLMVRSVVAETIETSTYGGHFGVARGRVTVEFDGPNGLNFDVDWTYRGDPPAVGSRWTLVQKDPAEEEA